MFGGDTESLELLTSMTVGMEVDLKSVDWFVVCMREFQESLVWGRESNSESYQALREKESRRQLWLQTKYSGEDWSELATFTLVEAND